MKIVIVGGGTAGWLTALYLQKFVGESQVTLLASPDIGIIGVGEATLPNFSDFLHQVDIDEREFMIESSASYKVGIQFTNWSATMPNFNVGFDVGMTKTQYGNIPFSNYWKEYFQQYNYGLINDPSSLVIQNRRSPYTDPNTKGLPSYAFHFDTVKVGGFLKNKAISRGVSYIETTISRVIHNEDGGIKELIDKEGNSIQADLYVDCSGFKNLLIGATEMNNPFRSYGDELLCDTAVVARTYYENEDTPIPSHTESIAMNAGWRWRIPLYDKIGNGYVFSSKYIQSDDARIELLTNIGLPLDTPCNFVKMKIGRHQSAWKNNVLGIGGAYGFIEPLESTALYLVCKQLELFVQHHVSDNMDGYNSITAKYYDDIKNFIVFHYFSSQKTETPFWRYYNTRENFSSDFLKIVNFLEKKFPDSSFDTDLNFPKELPGQYAYTRICIGQGFFPGKSEYNLDPTILKQIEKDIGLSYLANTKVADKCIDHRLFLKSNIYGKN